MIVAAIATSLVVTVSAMAAYPLSRMEFRGREAIYTFFTFGLLFPIAVAALPLYLLLRQLGLLESLLGVALAEAAFAHPAHDHHPAAVHATDPGRARGRGRDGRLRQVRVLPPHPRPALAARPGDGDDPLGHLQLEQLHPAAARAHRPDRTGRFPSASRRTRRSTARTPRPSSRSRRSRWCRRSRSSSSRSGASSAGSPARSRADAAGVEFANPVLPGMHPDPSVCRVGRDLLRCLQQLRVLPRCAALYEPRSRHVAPDRTRSHPP